jgi:hypothetical protein
MKLKPGDRVFVYGPCTSMDWHVGDKAYKVISVDDSDGSVEVQVGSKKYWPDVCEVHERQCELKKPGRGKGDSNDGLGPRKNKSGKRAISKSKR